MPNSSEHNPFEDFFGSADTNTDTSDESQAPERVDPATSSENIDGQNAAWTAVQIMKVLADLGWDGSPVSILDLAEGLGWVSENEYQEFIDSPELDLGLEADDQKLAEANKQYAEMMLEKLAALDGLCGMLDHSSFIDRRIVPYMGTRFPCYSLQTAQYYDSELNPGWEETFAKLIKDDMDEIIQEIMSQAAARIKQALRNAMSGMGGGPRGGRSMLDDLLGY